MSFDYSNIYLTSKGEFILAYCKDHKYKEIKISRIDNYTTVQTRFHSFIVEWKRYTNRVTNIWKKTN
jgi:hypothetical protein